MSNDDDDGTELFSEDDVCASETHLDFVKIEEEEHEDEEVEEVEEEVDECILQYAAENCTHCSRKYCNGIQHNHSEYTYPTCDTCGIELMDLIELVENCETRSNESCEICEMVYENPNEKNLHIPMHFIKNTNSADLKFFCVECLAAKLGESSTIDAKNGAAINTTPASHFPCNYCENIYTSMKCLRSHIRTKHVVDIPTNKSQFLCSICKAPSKSLSQLHVHREREHNIKKLEKEVYRCRLCVDDTEYTNRTSRARHEIFVHQNKKTKLYDCPHCYKTFKTVSVLEMHLVVHSEVKPYECDTCGKCFARINHLQAHMMIHSDEKPFTCSLCPDKSFKSGEYLKKHQRAVHTDVRRYQCEQCVKTYKDASDLRRHRWSHGGYEKKFECHLCEKKFYENKNLRYHMKSHKKDVYPTHKNNLKALAKEMRTNEG